MHVRVTIAPDNIVQVAIVDGTFEQAKPKLEALLRDLGLAGVAFVQETAVEAHRHTPEEIAAHEREHHHS